jgi:hypothetical protein
VPNSKVSSWLTKVTVLTTKIALTFLYYLSSPPLSHSLVGSDTFLFNKRQYFIEKKITLKMLQSFVSFLTKKKISKKKKKTP